MSFCFIHAADIHLDSPLSGLAKYDENAAEDILTASRGALEALVQLAIEESVAFVVIAGDLYDGDWRDYQTGLFLVEQMSALANAGIPAYLLHGNHDAASKITKSLPFPKNVFRFPSNAPATFSVEDRDISLHGQSFAKQAVTDNLVPNYPAPVADHFNIGVLHTALEGSSLHANYAPCSLTELQTKGYDYWALGHVHQHAVLSMKPPVVFPGNLQGRNIRETGPKGACLVTVEDNEVTDITHVPLDVARWALVQVDVSKDARYSDVIDRIGERIREAVETEADGRLLACRIELIGQTALHSELTSRIDDLRQNIIALTLHDASDTAWLEKIKVRTTPAVDAATMAEREDALGELFRALPEATSDEDFKAGLMGVFHDFRSALPHDVREKAEDELLLAAMEDRLDDLIEGVRAELVTDLIRSGGDD